MGAGAGMRVRGGGTGSALAVEEDAPVRPAVAMTRSKGASALGLRPPPRAPAGVQDRSGGVGSHFPAGLRVISAEELCGPQLHACAWGVAGGALELGKCTRSPGPLPR